MTTIYRIYNLYNLCSKGPLKTFIYVKSYDFFIYSISLFLYSRENRRTKLVLGIEDTLRLLQFRTTFGINSGNSLADAIYYVRKRWPINRNVITM